MGYVLGQLLENYQMVTNPNFILDASDENAIHKISTIF
jgi:hypothetical protein